MEKNEQMRNGQRNSLATKVASLALVGGLAFGSVKLVEYSDKKFDEEYGWLKDKPQAVQVEWANKTFDTYARRGMLSESLRHYHIKTFLNGLNG
jgi:hypothetical protein